MYFSGLCQTQFRKVGSEGEADFDGNGTETTKPLPFLISFKPWAVGRWADITLACGCVFWVADCAIKREAKASPILDTPIATGFKLQSLDCPQIHLRRLPFQKLDNPRDRIGQSHSTCCPRMHQTFLKILVLEAVCMELGP